MKSDVGVTVDFRGALGTILPADLAAAVVATILADAAVLVGAPQVVRLPAAAALLFVLPGYALVAALYPGAAAAERSTSAAPGLGERLALSVAASVALVPIVGLVVWEVLSLSGASLSLWRAPSLLLPVLTLVVLVGCAVASLRRLRRPRVDRFALPYDRWTRAVRGAFLDGDTLDDRLLNVALAASIVLALGTFGYAVASPAQAESYTTVGLTTQGEDGDLVAAGYPAELDVGQPTDLVLTLGNHEGERVAYSVVVRLERVRTGGDSVFVTEGRELDRRTVAVPAGETRAVPHRLAPSMAGDRLRLSYYVYRGTAPETPSADSAYRHVYLWISVEG